MEILARIFFALNAVLLLVFLINYLFNNYLTNIWQELLGFITTAVIILNVLTCFVASNSEAEDALKYKQGYQDALNTKFEQRIDTVYIKK